MLTVQEKNRGTTGNSGGWKYDYIVRATDADLGMTEFEAIAEVGNTVVETLSDGLGGELFLSDLQLENFVVSPVATIAFISAIYAPPDQGTPLSSGTPEAVYEFSYQAPSEHVYHAIAQRRYGPGGLGDAPDLGLRLKVSIDGETLGLDLPAGNTTNVWRLTVPAGFVSSAYESLVESLMGSVNSSDFKGRPPGSMRFVQCNSSLTRGGSMSMTWGMQFSVNATGLTLPTELGFDISGVDKLGHELLWRYDNCWVADEEHKKKIPSTAGIYVAQVFPTADLNQLGF